MARLQLADLPAPPRGLRFRMAGAEAAPALNGFHNRIFGQERPLAVCRWKYFDPALGENRVGLAEEVESGRIVAAHPAVRRRLLVDGEEHRVYQIADMAVDPAWRRGIALYKAFVHWVQWRGVLDDGIVFGYGGRISAANRKVGQRLVGYRELFTLTTWERRLGLRAAIGRRLGTGAGELAGRISRRFAGRRRGGGEGWELRPAVFDGRYDRLWRRLAARMSVALVRDAAVLGWRYGRNPAGRFLALEAVSATGLQGYAVARLWREGDVRVATILDLQAAGGPGAADALLEAFAAEAARADCDLLWFAVPAAGPLRELLARARGWRPAPEAPDHVIGKTLPPDPAAHGAARLAARLENGGAWFYLQGDSDYRE